MTRWRTALAFGALALTGCSGATARPAATAAPTDWRRIIMPADLNRLRQWREAFVKALIQARIGGNGSDIVREGALFDPDAAMTPASLSEGSYRCRAIKLGIAGPGTLPYVAYPPFDCRVTVEGGMTLLTKLNGSQRPVGRLFEDGPMRQIFLGTLMLGDETRPFDYGVDPNRDMVGAVQRIGAKRWRLILPYPRFESVLDVIELVPVD